MATYLFDNLHNHATWGPQLSHAVEDDGRLHRHRVAGAEAHPVFTTWAHNTPAHSHRLPDGSWSRPRTVARPPDIERQTLDRSPLDRLRIRRDIPTSPVAPDDTPLAPPVAAVQTPAPADQLVAEPPDAGAKRDSRGNAAESGPPDLSALTAALTPGPKTGTAGPPKMTKSRGRRTTKTRGSVTAAG